jgi:hypothetical protein
MGRNVFWGALLSSAAIFSEVAETEAKPRDLSSWAGGHSPLVVNGDRPNSSLNWGRPGYNQSPYNQPNNYYPYQPGINYSDIARLALSLERAASRFRYGLTGVSWYRPSTQLRRASEKFDDAAGDLLVAVRNRRPNSRELSRLLDRLSDREREVERRMNQERQLSHHIRADWYEVTRILQSIRSRCHTVSVPRDHDYHNGSYGHGASSGNGHGNAGVFNNWLYDGIPGSVLSPLSPPSWYRDPQYPSR